MKVKDITDAIYGAQNVIAELGRDEESYNKNKYAISRIEDLIKVIEDADISIGYGNQK